MGLYEIYLAIFGRYRLILEPLDKEKKHFVLCNIDEVVK